MAEVAMCGKAHGKLAIARMMPVRMRDLRAIGKTQANCQSTNALGGAMQIAAAWSCCDRNTGEESDPYCPSRNERYTQKSCAFPIEAPRELNS
ncbi:hypothetical protein AGR1B_pAt30392 [Agrobacterium fabacearum S56]|nr:hypothetical protein AGR1B_pAt30392 [Agrobacterium fabacearum S56]